MGAAELWNGGTRVFAWGGANDARAGSVAAAAFDCANSRVTAAAAALASAKGAGFVLSGSGVPAGVPQGVPVWVSCAYGSTPGLCALRGTAGNASDTQLPAWAPGVSYGFDSVVRANGAVLQASVAGVSATTESGPGVNLTGSPVVDGTVTWLPFNLAFGTPGTGMAEVVPVVTTFPGSSWIGALPDCTVPWVGAVARPALLPAYDEVYLTRKTRLVPPYDLTILRVLDGPSYDVTYAPNVPTFPADLNQTGDGSSDERIGYLNQSQAKLLLTPFDPIRERICRRLAFGFADMPIWWDDERTGRPVVCTSTAYAGLIANAGFALGNWGVGNVGSPGWQGLGASRSLYQFRYNPLLDGSHLPSPWVMPYLRTGHAVFSEIAASETCAALASQFPQARNRTIEGVAYQNLVTTPGTQQVRGIGWALRQIGMLDAMMADADPLRGFVRDTMSDNANYAAALPGTVDPHYLALGLLYSYDGESVLGETLNFRPWFYSILTLCAGMEAWRGDRLGWLPYLAALSKLSVGMWDQRGGGSGYFANLYTMALQSAPGVGNTYPSWAAAYAANYPQAPALPAGVLQLDSSGHVTTNFNGVMQAGASFPGDVTGYYPFAVAQLAVQAAAGVAGAAEVYGQLKARAATTPLIGTAWEGSIRGNPPATYPAWAVVQP